MWRDVRSRNRGWSGSGDTIVGLHDGNRIWRVSPDNPCVLIQWYSHIVLGSHQVTLLSSDPPDLIIHWLTFHSSYQYSNGQNFGPFGHSRHSWHSWHSWPFGPFGSCPYKQWNHHHSSSETQNVITLNHSHQSHSKTWSKAFSFISGIFIHSTFSI